MRFVCDSCRTQYMISDDKVGAKGIKVRCKKCSFVISVRRPEAAAQPDFERTQLVANPLAQADAASSGSSGEATPPDGSLFDGATDDELGAVFDQMLSTGPQQMSGGSEPKGDGEEAPEERESLESTRMLDVATMQRLADESAQDAAAGEAAPSVEWYVAIDDKQVGPLDLDKVRDHWERGEVGPDSLCWRAGMADWLPLSEVSELQRHLAPRPAKPVIFAPEAPAPASTPTAHVESAFAASAPVKPASAAPASDSGKWKPSAASGLASLVKEEMEALARPPAPKGRGAESAAAMPGLLDVPVLQPSAPPVASMAQAPAQPFAAEPAAYAAAPGYAGAPGYAQQAGYSPVPFATPGRTASGAKSGRGLYIGLAAGALLIAVASLAFVIVPKLGEEPAPSAPVVAQQEPQPPAQPELPRAEASATTPVQPPSVPPAAVQPAAGTVAPAGPVVAQAQPVSAPAAAPTALPPTPPAKLAAAPAVAEAPVKAPALPEARLRTELARDEESRRERRTERLPPRETARREEAPPRLAEREESKSDDPFEDIFGPPKSTPKRAEPKQEKAAVYVPPAPGSVDIPETLGQSDIMQVVLANKSSIVKCVQQQKAADPDLSGKLVMRWTVQTSGRVTGVSCQSPEFKDTQMASCVAGLIKSWNFPRHRKQGDAINFPFTF